MPPATEYTTLAFDGCSGGFNVLALGDDRYQILDPGICLLMEDYSCGDVIKAVRNEDDQLVVVERIERGGFKTLDFLLPQGWQENQQMVELFDKIKQHDGYAVGLFGGLLLIALPQDADYDPSDDIKNAMRSME